MRGPMAVDVDLGVVIPVVGGPVPTGRGLVQPGPVAAAGRQSVVHGAGAGVSHGGPPGHGGAGRPRPARRARGR